MIESKVELHRFIEEDCYANLKVRHISRLKLWLC